MESPAEVRAAIQKSLNERLNCMEMEEERLCSVIPRGPGGYCPQHQRDARQEFRKCIAAKDEAKILASLDQMMKNNWTVCLCPSLAEGINFFCEMKDLERAEMLVDYFKANCRIGHLDKYKIVKFARLLIENDRFEDALVFLETQESLKPGQKTGIDGMIRSLMRVAQRRSDEVEISRLRVILEAKNFL